MSLVWDSVVPSPLGNETFHLTELNHPRRSQSSSPPFAIGQISAPVDPSGRAGQHCPVFLLLQSLRGTAIDVTITF
jgi:hypothetical protein